MDDVIYPPKCPVQAFLIAYITDEIAHAWIFLRGKDLLHLELLEFIPGKNDKPLWFVVLQDDFDAFLAKRTGTAGDEECFIGKHYASIS